MTTRREPVTDAEKAAANADPITNEPGAHPVGTGVGAALGGAAVGTAAGMVAGPIGAVVGAVVGGVAGGLGGKAVAEEMDPTVELEYWRKEYPNTRYYDSNIDYSNLEPAYRYGYVSRSAHAGKQFDTIERDLQRDWDQHRGNSNLTWEQARHATRDAWERAEKAKACRDRKPI